MNRRGVRLNVNGGDHVLDVSPETRLIYILRNDLELNGPKFGCGLGECGACAVLVDGRAVRSCTLSAAAVENKSVVTLEGLGTSENPHPVQRAFIEMQAAQCGYCVNGMIIAVAGLLNRNPAPDDTAIRAALAHQLCRCGTHMEIIAAAKRSAELMRGAT